MISINKLNKININSNHLVNFLFCFFPVSFIIGNLFVNLNLILFCFLGIFNLKEKIFQIKFNIFLKIILIFFILIIFSTVLSFAKSLINEGYSDEIFSRLLKSLVFLRYYLFLLIVYCLNKFHVINLKYFFISAGLTTILISIDVIFQYIFGFNLAGLKNIGFFNSSFFGDELIAGGFIQRFSFFSIFFIYFIFEKNFFFRSLFVIISVCILGASIILSGNRMPFILFLIGLFFIFFCNKNFFKIIPISFLGLFLIFKFINTYDAAINSNYLSYMHHVKNISTGIKNKIISIDVKQTDSKTNAEISDNNNNPNQLMSYSSSHFRIFLSAIETWKTNKVFGNGIKSFRTECRKLQYEFNIGEDLVKDKKNRLCSNHPHNYYLEVLTETGLIGLFVFLVISILFILFIFRKFSYLRGNNTKDFILLASLVGLILEMLPIRSTGSFFSTSNITYIVLMSSIIISHSSLLKNKNFN